MDVTNVTLILQCIKCTRSFLACQEPSASYASTTVVATRRIMLRLTHAPNPLQNQSMPLIDKTQNTTLTPVQAK